MLLSVAMVVTMMPLSTISVSAADADYTLYFKSIDGGTTYSLYKGDTTIPYDGNAGKWSVDGQRSSLQTGSISVRASRLHS